MRRARDTELLRSDDGMIIGVNLGADYCAEHEWGIEGIRRALGISDDESVFGIERRRVTVVPPFLTFDNGALIMWRCWDESRRSEFVRSLLEGELRFYSEWDRATRKDLPPKPGIVAAWDGDSFGLHVKGAEHVAALATIFDALERKDAAVWCGSGGVFKNAGLVIGIVSRIPAEGLATMREADEDRAKLKAAARDTGIEDRLKNAGRRWFALSPRWKSKTDKTAHSVVFWLNPQEQSIHSAGWFTVEQLDDWAHGRGPVMEVRR